MNSRSSRTSLLPHEGAVSMNARRKVVAQSQLHMDGEVIQVSTTTLAYSHYRAITDMPNDNTWTGRERRAKHSGFGSAPVRREGGWNYEVERGGIERRRDSPDYTGYWERLAPWPLLKHAKLEELMIAVLNLTDTRDLRLQLMPEDVLQPWVVEQISGLNSGEGRSASPLSQAPGRPQPKETST